jgi:hypothetical protein
MTAPRHTRGYEICMRVDTRKSNGEYFAVIPSAYTAPNGARYYLGVSSSDGVWTELTPEYVTRCTRTTADYPQWLKRRADTAQGYILHTVSRLG